MRPDSWGFRPMVTQRRADGTGRSSPSTPSRHLMSSVPCKHRLSALCTPPSGMLSLPRLSAECPLPPPVFSGGLLARWPMAHHYPPPPPRLHVYRVCPGHHCSVSSPQPIWQISAPSCHTGPAPAIYPPPKVHTGEGRFRNMRNLEWRNLVRTTFGTKYETPMGLWLVALKFSRLLDGCVDGCSCFLEAVGHNGNAHANRANNDTKGGVEPLNTMP